MPAGVMVMMLRRPSAGSGERSASVTGASDDGPTRFALLEPDRDASGALIPNRGLLALPEPALGDIFFDIEGARYYSEDNREFGLQYLFGVVDTADLDEAGRPRYTLMGRFATREDEVDNLFRLGVFVDLYRVVRQGGAGRRGELLDQAAALEDGTAAVDAGRQAVVAGYNEDDCRATLALRDWLEDRRRDLAERAGQELARPFVVEATRAPEDPEVTRIRSALLAGVSAETSARTDEERARALLADLIDWHRREDKPAWWRHFYLRTLSSAELIGEPDALGGAHRRPGLRRAAADRPDRERPDRDDATAGAASRPWRPSGARVCVHAGWRGLAPRIGQRADRDNPFLHLAATGMTPERLERALRDGELDVAAGTAWPWAHGGLANASPEEADEVARLAGCSQAACGVIGPMP